MPITFSEWKAAFVFDTMRDHLALLAQSRAAFLERLCQTFADVTGLPLSECEVIEQRRSDGVFGPVLMTYTVQRRQRGPDMVVTFE